MSSDLEGKRNFDPLEVHATFEKHALPTVLDEHKRVIKELADMVHNLAWRVEILEAEKHVGLVACLQTPKKEKPGKGWWPPGPIQCVISFLDEEFNEHTLREMSVAHALKAVYAYHLTHPALRSMPKGYVPSYDDMVQAMYYLVVYPRTPSDSTPTPSTSTSTPPTP